MRSTDRRSGAQTDDQRRLTAGMAPPLRLCTPQERKSQGVAAADFGQCGDWPYRMSKSCCVSNTPGGAPSPGCNCTGEGMGHDRDKWQGTDLGPGATCATHDCRATTEGEVKNERATPLLESRSTFTCWPPPICRGRKRVDVSPNAGHIKFSMRWRTNNQVRWREGNYMERWSPARSSKEGDTPLPGPLPFSAEGKRRGDSLHQAGELHMRQPTAAVPHIL